MDIMRPIAITPGEPAGIGPDLTLKLASLASYPMVAVADPVLLRQRADLLGLNLAIEDYRADRPLRDSRRPRLPVLPVATPQTVECGKLNPLNSSYVLETLRQAAEGCLNREFSALVTGPVHKGVINRSGVRFTGHTDFLAELCRRATGDDACHSQATSCLGDHARAVERSSGRAR